MPGRKNVTISSPTEGYTPKIHLPAKEPVNGIPGTAPQTFAPISSPLMPQNSGKKRANVNNEHNSSGSN